jgi:hypothetical protein
VELLLQAVQHFRFRRLNFSGGDSLSLSPNSSLSFFLEVLVNCGIILALLYRIV